MMEIYSVGQVTAHLKELIEVDSFLQDLWLEGEVSNFTISASGHAYFTLKDSAAAIRCVLFRGHIVSRDLLPKHGDAAVAHGRVSIYEPQGSYQFYVDLVRPRGVGLLHLQFEALRARLEQEGLFDPARKRPIPRFPRSVGIVTSTTGAALRDILNIIGRRFPAVEVVISPTLVQGDEAAPRICRAIEALNQFADVDTIIVARGGGSLEDLWPFNDESVARAIYASRHPVVTGVGHETDFTIADFVADLRAPTPSAAAELVVPDAREWREALAGQDRRLRLSAGAFIEGKRGQLAERAAQLQRLSPVLSLERHRLRLDELAQRSQQALDHLVILRRAQLQARALQLQALDPRAVLARGYAICRQLPSGAVVRSTGQVQPGDPLEVQVADGAFPAEVRRQARLF